MLYFHYSDYNGEWKWKNFSAKELSCNCCGEYYHDEDSLNMLQAARELASKPFKVNSAHRCVRHNKSVGGSERSQHLNIAFDISLSGHDHEELLQALFDGGFTTFGLYASFVHTDKREYKFWQNCSSKLWGDIYRKVISSHD